MAKKFSFLLICQWIALIASSLTYRNYFKVVIVGSMGTGKTSLINALTRAHFNPFVTSTLGFDWRFSHFLASNSLPVDVCLWDTAGQETYSAMMPQCTKGADVIILTFDSTNHQSHDDVEGRWVNSVEELKPCRTCKVIVVATMMDIIKTGNDNSSNSVAIHDYVFNAKFNEEWRDPGWMDGKDAEILMKHYKYDAFMAVSAVPDFDPGLSGRCNSLDELKTKIADFCLERQAERTHVSKHESSIKLKEKNQSCCNLL